MSSTNTISGIVCTNCGKNTYPKRIFCPSCRNKNVKDWLLPTEGTIFSFTVVNFPLEHYTNAPYYVGLISLNNDNKTLVTAKIVSKDAQSITIGQYVTLLVNKFTESGELDILVAHVK